MIAVLTENKRLLCIVFADEDFRVFSMLFGVDDICRRLNDLDTPNFLGQFSLKDF
jgi:hypothetical protein